MPEDESIKRKGQDVATMYSGHPLYPSPTFHGANKNEALKPPYLAITLHFT